MDNIEVGEIVSLIKDGKTYNQISETLQEMYPDVRGFSLNSVKRFCTKNNLSTRMSEGVIKEAVKNAVNEVSICLIGDILDEVRPFFWRLHISHQYLGIVFILGWAYVWKENDEWFSSAKT